MADIGYTETVYEDGYYEDEAPREEPQQVKQAGSVGKLVSIVGAVASLALVAGVGVWSYKLMVRDVSGVPVVRAADGPMRVQPENPGGRQADHQGLAVNAVAAQGTAAPTADRLVLAPRPVALAEEDGPVAVRADETPVVQAALPVAPPSDDAAPTENADNADALEAFRNGSVSALVEQLTQGVEPLTEIDEQPELQATETVQPETLTQDDQIVADATPALHDGPGLTRSLRPLARPAGLMASANRNAMSEALSTAVETAASLDVDADSLPVGTRLAQLGAYDSAEIAKAEWDRIYSRFEDYMQDKKRVIQKASSGGRTFYRLRAMGFTDLSDARRFCSALVAENADCIPVTTR